MTIGQSSLAGFTNLLWILAIPSSACLQAGRPLGHINTELLHELAWLPPSPLTEFARLTF